MTATASTAHLELPIRGMTCASCANHIERRLNKIDGVVASVNYATETAAVGYDPAAVAPDVLVDAVQAAGYQAALPSQEPVADVGGEDDDPTRPLLHRLVISALLAVPVLVLSMVSPLQFDNWQWLSLTMSTPVVVWGAWPFHRA